MSKSRPTYGPLRCDPTGRRHLLVFQTAAAVADADGFGPVAGRRVQIWAAGAGAGDPGYRRFGSAPALFEALAGRLQAETMGLRLYGVGDESFLWDLFGLASAAGLGRREVVLSRAGGPGRRVRCVHCATMNEDVHADLVVCRGCGLTLAVRDHFSRRLSAFMGVHADAEAPGDLPEPKALAG